MKTGPQTTVLRETGAALEERIKDSREQEDTAAGNYLDLYLKIWENEKAKALNEKAKPGKEKAKAGKEK